MTRCGATFLAALIAAGCSGAATSGSAATPPPTTAAPPAVPVELIADAIGLDGPEGTFGWTVLVDSGYGSYSISTPDGWIGWTLGADPGPVAAVLETQDAEWGGRYRFVMGAANADGGNSILRAVFAAPGSGDFQAAAVWLFPAPEPADGDYEPALLGFAEEIGLEVIEGTGQSVDDGARMEIVGRVADPGGAGPLTVHAAFIVDEPNGYLWIVECRVDEAVATEWAAACTNLTRSFQPHGAIEP